MVFVPPLQKPPVQQRGDKEAKKVVMGLVSSVSKLKPLDAGLAVRGN